VISAALAAVAKHIGFAPLDYIALVLFFASWVLHFWIINHSELRHKTISFRMHQHRQRWMMNMVLRDPKMPDVLIQNTLQYGVLFFASTSILLIGGLMAALGASDQAQTILKELPFASPFTQTAWELKVLLVIFIFTFAFFKFAWSYRLFNYVLIMIGGAPDPGVRQPVSQERGGGESAVSSSRIEEYHERYATSIAQMHTLAARHFTTGMNSYFFALAAIAWFVSPLLFIVATIWVSLVLYRRAFRSQFASILRNLEEGSNV
jgi:uncharacterized membrane protein